MGCNIYFHTEVKINGQWHHYSTNSLKRDYRFFAKMANVRNQDNRITPISQPKGLPDDISLITKIEADQLGKDGHSHSWLGIEEIRQLRKEIGLTNFSETYPFLFGYLFYDLTSIQTEISPTIEDARFVFWFNG